MASIRKRARFVAASNRMTHCTDASLGVVPLAVAEDAIADFWDAAIVAGVNDDRSTRPQRSREPAMSAE